MKVLWILLVVILAIFLFVGYTAYQAYSVIKEVNSGNFREDLQALSDGDCSKLENVESDFDVVKVKVNSACKNPVLKKVVASKFGEYDVCSKPGQVGSAFDEFIDDKRAECGEQNA